ncbi:LysE family translocator [Mesobacterium pallidum]|uniref:LysE family translocator n=1 Tax=Mesobacterium pallidum TaxID=2872037 RepID=UPI001EE34F8C|nr:LysE family translocator [Mesobacterium pallidum]
MTPDPLVLLAFVPAALALNITPGADMMFCLAQGLRRGARAATLASAGIALGGLIHAAIAGLGLSALVEAWPPAFDLIRWAGVGYLLWLAWGALRGGGADKQDLPPGNPFLQGLMVNLTNPKVILFVLAFVPQFVRPEDGAVLAQFLVFGLVLSLGGFIINAAVGIASGGIGRKLAGGGRVLGYVTAGIYSALALRLAMVSR